MAKQQNPFIKKRLRTSRAMLPAVAAAKITENGMTVEEEMQRIKIEMYFQAKSFSHFEKNEKWTRGETRRTD